MRLDRFLSETGCASRKEAALAAKRGGVTVNGFPVRDASSHIDPDADAVVFLGQPVVYRKFLFFLLNKPEGYVSATDDKRFPFVTELLPDPYRRMGLFPVGRLDKDTVGLMILTNDGVLAHTLLSPKHHVEKEYRFRCADPLSPDAEAVFATGMTLGDGEECKPAVLRPDPGRTSGTVILTEGKYHQIKRMMGALGNKITELERIRFSSLTLPPDLPRGQCRELTEEEIAVLRAAAL